MIQKQKTKSDRTCEMLGKVIAYIIAITVCIGIVFAAIWLVQQILHCIENILHTILFFAAAALGG